MASEIAIEDTPRRTCLKRSIRQLSKESYKKQEIKEFTTNHTTKK